MPLYVADYLADTGHLSAAEHGAYLLLIMHYWQNGGLPNEDRRLARIARMSAAEWDDARETLFDMFEDCWRHHRIDAELKAAQEISEKAKEKAAKRWQKNGTAPADAEAMPVHMPETCQPQSQSPTTTVSNDPVVVRAKAQPEQARILESLMSILTEDRARAVVDHRRKKKSPLTLHAANLLVGQFSQLAEPDKAADLMISRGWQGCDPDWCVNAGLKRAEAVPHSSDLETQWRNKLTRYRDKGDWPGVWGDPPGHPCCTIPAAFIAKFDTHNKGERAA